MQDLPNVQNIICTTNVITKRKVRYSNKVYWVVLCLHAEQPILIVSIKSSQPKQHQLLLTRKQRVKVNAQENKVSIEYGTSNNFSS